MPDPRVVSFKCKCFRILGRRFVYPRNDVIKESVKFNIESLQTSAKFHFGPDLTTSQKVGPLSASPSRVYSGQKVLVSFPSGPEGNPIAIHLGWFGLSDPIRIWEGVGKGGITDVVVEIPTVPKDKWLELSVECGNSIISMPIWSNGNKIEGKWNLNHPSSVVADYCGSNNGEDSSVEELSYYTYNDVEGDVCRMVALSFVTINGTINGADVVSLANFRNVGLPVHTKWSIEEVGYYGMERPVVYEWGDVINGELIGLPDFWSPPVYGYTGYMNLTLRC
jgi:hypothetical protein